MTLLPESIRSWWARRLALRITRLDETIKTLSDTLDNTEQYDHTDVYRGHLLNRIIDLARARDKAAARLNTL